MSGGWFAASASSATRSTKAIAAAKSRKLSSRTIDPFSLRQSASCRCCSIRASLSSAIVVPSILGRRLRVRGARGVRCSGRAVFGARGVHRVMVMRIVSLVPHATELLFALGLGPEVIAVTHECDYPLEALQRRRVTRDVLPSGLSAGEIDAAVRERT